MQMFTVFYYNTSADIAKFVNKIRYIVSRPQTNAVLFCSMFLIYSKLARSAPKIPRRYPEDSSYTTRENLTF